MGEGVKILEKGDVAPGSSTAVDVREQKVAVFNVAGTFYAIDDTCTHALVPIRGSGERNNGDLPPGTDPNT